MSVKRAVGTIRVSRVNGREGDSFRSPETQRDRIAEVCADHGWELADVFEELDVSGSKGLADRPGLRKAVEAIEAKRAQVLVVAYFDRLCRSPSVRDEVLDRVEAAGGEIWSADMGQQSNGSAAERFTGGVLAQAARFVLDSAAEKARAAQVEAVEAGVWMSPAIPPGYVRGDDRHLAPDPEAAPVVAEAFRMRADGATIEAVRLYLREHGIERTYKAIGFLLHSRVVLGELHFGKLDPNLSAHPAIVERATWERVQRVTVPRGRKPQSARLLARLGVLRCGSCGSRMSVSSSNRNKYPTYRCGQAEYCERRQTITAPLVEAAVVAEVKRLLGDIEGTASGREDVDRAAEDFDQAQTALDSALRVLTDSGLLSEPVGVEQLTALREARDTARDRHEEKLADRDATEVAVSAKDWEALTLDERRDLIRAVVERVEVNPGRGLGRLSIVPKGALS